ncbi:MAG TPA: DUF4446 family protein [Parcubacteria group bacterium]|jgi:uncharacterized membrane protein YqgA involved in biofilm formation|nr:DUF4446 family protein [Parcubacteria group bacterium]
MESLLSNQLYVVYALIGTILILLGYIIKLDRKLKKFLIGKDAKTLEDSILSAKENIEKLNIFQKEVIGHFTNVEKRLNRSVQAIETLRFNPFKGTGDGGNQSFSTALINQNGDGVILSSLYSRDRISVFSKPVVKFQSTFELTPEEVEVLNNSKNQLKS